MRFRPLTWWLLSLFLFLAGGIVWHLSNRYAEEHAPAKIAAPAATNTVTPAAPVTAAKPGAIAAAKAHPQVPFRLANTSKTLRELTRTRTAILLENALIDTAEPLPLEIPAHLRVQGDGGSYLVQARGALDERFRAQLAQAGAEIVSFIPENAYLVRVSAEGAAQLAGLPETQAVLAFEPYYKIKGELLKFAAKQAALPAGTTLRVLLFAGAEQGTWQQIEQLGGKVSAPERTPFGTVVTVQPPLDALPALAQLPGVQSIEQQAERALVNDLSRVKLGVAPNTLSITSTPPYLNLTGSNVLVNVNDSGIDGTHPDLFGRVFGDVLSSYTIDTEGHGTHVAGSIAGSGKMSFTVTNAAGSVAGADFRGIAPNARLYSLPFQSENTYLQETAARTNVFISNNSWAFVGQSTYNLAAACYDAAVRDALPSVTGSQPLMYVFAAGNAGSGGVSGSGGEAGTVLSPGTGKNVITVGAVEQLRNITNKYTPLGSTNAVDYFLPRSDSSSQVAGYSSRGNVGIGVEGEFGRFKPDVVAPGSFVISTRSTNWDQKSYYSPSNYSYGVYEGQTIYTNEQFDSSVFVPVNAAQLRFQIFPNVDSPTPFPGLPLFVSSTNGLPATNGAPASANNSLVLNFGNNFTNLTDVNWFYTIINPTNVPVSFDLVVTLITTNDNGDYQTVWSNLNQSIAPYYRYESGSSMAAAQVSGVLALMQEFFEQKLKLTNSPALMKALLINGARSLGNAYDLQVPNIINYQGWGIVNVTNTIAAALTNGYNAAAPPPGPVMFFDQNPTNALATGESLTRYITLSNAARNQPLRVTLVWTDPPGNPVAGIKLVNDLDLVVTNLDDPANPLVYFGNDIQAGADVCQPWDTNSPAVVDAVNNVENVYLARPLGTNYSITVAARRVAVNAVTAHTNNVVQDYALVISDGNGTLTNAITLSNAVTFSTAANLVTNDGLVISQFPLVSRIPSSNTVMLLQQRVSANTPLLGTTNGMTNQWHFYIFTNPPTNSSAFTNVAFATFLPPSLALPREGVFANDPTNATRLEADIDLYVSTDPGLTNLDPAIVGTATHSRTRGGSETIIFSNSAPGVTYYIGVKSEDQMAAEYGFFGAASDEPFSSRDSNGNLNVRMMPLPQDIPDGTPAKPGAAIFIGFAVDNFQVRRVMMTNNIVHERTGDLLFNLRHGLYDAVLYNHSDADAFNIIEDNGESAAGTTRRSDGPGDLRQYIGESVSGQWLLTAFDGALNHTGQVQRLDLHLEPLQETNGTVEAFIEAGADFLTFVDVPPEATNLVISIAGNTAPLDVSFRYGAVPTVTRFDYTTNILAPGGSIYLDRTTTNPPALLNGRYYIRVHNPNATVQHVFITTAVGLDVRGVLPDEFPFDGLVALPDDAVTYATGSFTNNHRVYSAEVGVRINHPRVSDLAITLVSPRGTRVLLSENRGGLDANGFGSSVYITNVVSAQALTNDISGNTNVVDTGQESGAITIDFTPFQITDSLRVYYGTNRIFDSGYVSGNNLQYQIGYAPTNGTSTSVVTIIVNEGGNTNACSTNSCTSWNYTATFVNGFHNYFTFTDDTNKTTTPIKFYPPPFVPSPAAVVFTNGFEGGAPGNYFNGSVVDGWRVTNAPWVSLHTNWTAGSNTAVTVITNPVYEGSRALALHQSAIERELSLVAGRKYRLGFAFHGVTNLNPVAWWPGNGNALDIWGGNNGTVVGNIGHTNGLVGQAFRFDGTGEVQVANNAALNLRSNVTFEMWVNPSVINGSFDMLLNKELDNATTASQAQYEIGIKGPTLGNCPGGSIPTGHFAYALFGVNGLPDEFCGWTDAGGAVPTNQWTHITLTFDGKSVKTYTNGVIARTVSGLSGALNVTTGKLRLGSRSPVQFISTDARKFTGMMDEVSIFDKVLTAEEVRAIYNAGSLGKCGTPTPPTICSLPVTTNALVGPVRNPTNNHYYYLLQTNTWTASEAQAVDLGGHLVTINDLAENNWVFNTFSTYSGTNTLWIGLRSPAQNNYTNWQWASGEPVTFLNWAPSEPSVGSSEYWTFMYSAGVPPVNSARPAGTWNNYTNDSVHILTNTAWPLYGVVEVPAPETAAQCTLAGLTNLVFKGTSAWANRTVGFVARSNTTTLSFSPTNYDSGVILDSITLYQLPTNGYALPEEPLTQLRGEPAAGEWKLELWDNRTGAVTLNGLLSWQLSLIFDNTSPISNPGVSPQITPDIYVCVPAGTMTNLTVRVPVNALTASNYLIDASGPLNVFYSTNAPLTGTNGGVPVLTGQSNGVMVFTTGMFVPGTNYYLAFQNATSNEICFGFSTRFAYSQNTPPVLPDFPEQLAFSDELFEFDVSAWDADFPPNTLTYALLSGPTNLVINPATGIVTWTPTTNDIGHTQFTVSVTDNGFPPLSDTNTYRVEVVGPAPTFATGIPAFPGAEGAGAFAVGGRRGDVYHVTRLELNDGPGSLRYGLRSSHRTIVFDVSGTITLTSDLRINRPYITIAGQTAPGEGITIKGRLVSVQNTHDVVIRNVRFRAGDLNCPNFQDDSFQVNRATNVIVDHISTSWSIDENLSVTHSTNVTVQWSMIADPLNQSCHLNDAGTGTEAHGYGSLLRYGNGHLSLHHNLYANNASRNPRLGDNLTLEFINNVIYGWKQLPGYSGTYANDIQDNPQGFTNRMNYVGNYGIAGSNSSVPARIFEGGTFNSWIYQASNQIDSNVNGILDGTNSDWAMFQGDYTSFAAPFTGFYGTNVTTHPADEAFERVLAFAGASVRRDSVDLYDVNGVRAQNGHVINSQSEVGGWPNLLSTPLPLGGDADNDGLPYIWEVTLGFNPIDGTDGNITNAIGYTRLEDYLSWMAEPHAFCNANAAVDVNLLLKAGSSGNLSFSVADVTNGTVALLPDGQTARFTPPTNGFVGLAAFSFTVTNNDTGVSFGPVNVGVLVSPGLFANTNTLTFIDITNNTTQFTLNELTALTVTNRAVSSNPSATLTYSLLVNPDGATINPFTGIISWIPQEAQGPGLNHEFVTMVMDSDAPPHTVTNLFTVMVDEVNAAPYFLTTPTNRTVAALFPLVITNTAFDPDIPTNILTYTLLITNNSALVTNSGAVISTNGVITWTPQVIGTYTLTTLVTDTNPAALTANTLTAQNSFQVVVAASAFAPFNFQVGNVTSNGILLKWSGALTNQFAIRWSTNAGDVVRFPTNWGSITGGFNFSGGVYSFFDDGTQTGGSPANRQCYYKLQLLP